MQLIIYIIDRLTILVPKQGLDQVIKIATTIFLHLNRHLFRRMHNDVKCVFPGLKPIETKQIVLESQWNHMTFFSTYRYFASAPISSIPLIIDNVEIIGHQHIQELYELNKPVVFISIHMGNFLKGFLKLATLAPTTKEIGIIKWMNESKKETAAYSKFKHAGVNLKIFRLRNKPALDTIRFLRKGNILLTLCDITSEFVKTTNVTLFNKKAQFPCGPAELAIASHAMMVPIYSTQVNGQDVITICKPIDSGHQKYKGRGLSEMGQKLTQQLANEVESWIKTYPKQWHFWGLLEALWEK